MKKNSCIILAAVIFAGAITTAEAGWTKEGSSHYKYELGSKLTGTLNGTIVTYELSLSPPVGSFITPSSFSNCTKVTDSSSTVAAKKVFDATQASDSDYSFGMSGKLAIGGEGSGIITWSTNVELEKPFFVYPKEGNTSIGDHPTITISASENADWSKGGVTNKNSVKIYVSGDPNIPAGTNIVTVENGKNQSISATLSGKSTPSDSATFTICRHGEWKGLPGSVSLTLNPAFLGKLNQALSYIKVPLTLSEAEASYSQKSREFCCTDGEVKTNIEIEKSSSVGVEITKRIGIWNLPTKEFNAGTSTLGFVFMLEAGLYIQPASVSFGFTQKQEKDLCLQKECTNTSMDGSWGIGFFFGVDAITCVKVFGLEGCGAVEVSGVAASSINVSGGHKTDDCDNSGFYGNVSVGTCTLTATAQLDGIGWQESWNIWDGTSFDF